jgi:hypothetical protein
MPPLRVALMLTPRWSSKLTFPNVRFMFPCYTFAAVSTVIVGQCLLSGVSVGLRLQDISDDVLLYDD